MELSNQIAVVTGGAGCIGRTIALKLAGAGASVVVCDLQEDKARTVADEIAARGGTAMPVAMDVRSTADIDRMTAQVMARFHRIDIEVNVAGGSAREQSSTVYGSQEEVIHWVLDVNLKGVIFCTRAVVGHMMEKRRGKIVNIASIVGIQGLAKCADYAAAKAGVIAFSKTLAMELGSYNINVNCVSPGLVSCKIELHI
jgi:3-oxoacyl-[acyl-carrier protein] reductase